MAGNTIDIGHVIFILKAVSLAYGLVGIGCLVGGALSIRYELNEARINIKFPYSTGSGIWTGIWSFIICLLGGYTFIRYNIESPRSSRPFVIAFYTFVIIDIVCGVLHIAYSSIGHTYCSSERRTGEIICNEEEKPRLIITMGFNIVFGAFITLLSVFVIIYMSVGRKIHTLSGWPNNEYMSCCCKPCIQQPYTV